jgi:CRP-like cAMP-binding protein
MRTVEHISQDKKASREQQSSSTQRHQAITDLWLFSPLTEEEKHALAERARDILLAPGQTLFHQNDTGESLFIIRQGQVEVLASHNNGPEAKVATLKSGDFFGEMSALTGQPRTATIRAVTPLACVEINKQDLQSIFNADPAMMEKMSMIIAQRNAERLSISKDKAQTAAAEQSAAVEQKTLFSRMLKFFKGDPNSIAAKP